VRLPNLSAEDEGLFFTAGTDRHSALTACERWISARVPTGVPFVRAASVFEIRHFRLGLTSIPASWPLRAPGILPSVLASRAAVR